MLGAAGITFVLLIVRFLFVESRYHGAKRIADGQLFPVTITVRLVLRIGGPFMLFVAYKAAQHIRKIVTG
jgi:hypothetical protein